MTSGLHPLRHGIPEPWAAEWGEDRFGVFMGFAVRSVVQRMRWIPPGRFTMGSPESEAGRREDEGPQHEVELSCGFWLADTPCTQALWQAVMGENPSRFLSPERPVEQVNWDDCQSFAAKLNTLLPGLGVRLPSEAEWEYACRAGTKTAIWTGDLDLRGENDAPALDVIAWYGGNSGHGVEVSNAHDFSNRPNEKYPHTQAGTRQVCGKLSNPLGLFDMLGNVFEWCSDRVGPYVATPTTDPPGAATGSLRVIRGGSWLDYARYIRAAHRRGNVPENRDRGLGFRLARGQGPSPDTESRRGAEPPLPAGERSRRP